ncbi:hypothetical protein ACFFJT_18510 [Dyella flava]|uniref:hypothetical protein n=1 Tax=Dyella flava TaxID=1920170 RepID=UPI001EF91BBD|nr:hypothetical protein [Dyella flava]
MIKLLEQDQKLRVIMGVQALSLLKQRGEIGLLRHNGCRLNEHAKSHGRENGPWPEAVIPPQHASATYGLLTVRRLALIRLRRVILVIVMVGIFLFVSRSIGVLVHSHRLMAELGRQQRAVCCDHGSLQGIRGLGLLQGVRKFFGGRTTQLGVLSNGFEQFNRI